MLSDWLSDMVFFGICLLLGLGAVTTWVGHRSRPEIVRWVGVTVLGLVFFLLLLSRSSLPMGFVVSNWSFSPWPWRLDRAAWLLSLGLVLPLLAGYLLAPAGERPWLSHLLLLAGFMSLWADSPAGLMIAWMLLSLLMLLASRDPAGGTLRLGGSWLALLSLGLAVAALPDPTLASNLDMGVWPNIAIAWIILAVILQGGLVPWLFGDQLSRPEGIIIPAGSAAMLLVRLADSRPAGPGFSLLLTLFGLIGLGLAANRAWAAIDRPVAVGLALFGGQACLVLLAGQWAGPAAVLAEARVLLLAGGALLLAAVNRQAALPKIPWLSKVGPVLGALALAGLPLTAGFGGRAALYDTWFAQGRFVLPFVTTLIQIPLAGAAILLAWTTVGEPIVGFEPLVWVLPGLFLVSLVGLADASLLAWILNVIPAGVGIALTRFVGETREAQTLLQKAFKLPISFRPVGYHLELVFEGFVIAMREAAAILEGEGGLLWVILLIVVVWLVR